MVADPMTITGIDETLLDLNTWETPKESYPVQVVSAHMKWSDAKYNAGTEFRPAFPDRGAKGGPFGNSIQQLELNMKRLDARYLLPDGTFADVIVYGGVDLEKYNRRTGTIERPKKTRSGQTVVIGAWSKLVGPLVPNPERLVGQFFMVDKYREYEIAPGNNGNPPFTAKNIVLPTEILPPTFTYTGNVTTIEVKRTDNIEDAAVASASAVNGQSASMASVENAAAKIATFLKGRNVAGLDVTLLNDPAFPADARREPFITAIASGAIVETLKANGVVLAIGDDGFIA